MSRSSTLLVVTDDQLGIVNELHHHTERLLSKTEIGNLGFRYLREMDSISPRRDISVREGDTIVIECWVCVVKRV